MFYLIFIFSITFSLSCVFWKCFTNATSARIQSLYSPFTFFSIWPASFQCFLIPVSPRFLAVSMSTLLIAHIYLPSKSIGLNVFLTFAKAILSFFLTTNCTLFFRALFDIITSFIAIIFVWRMLCYRICASYSFLLNLL